MPEQETSLKRSDAATLASQNTTLLVGELERALLCKMPADDACSWDRTGMLVGNPLDIVQGVAIALDPTLPALKVAEQAGANVLVTHHPVFLEAPTSFLPASIQGHTPGSVVRYACEHGISIMSFHTALDVSREGLAALPELLRLRSAGVLEPLESDDAKGFGCICEPSDEDQVSLRHLSARCVSVFGSHPRVWGPSDKTIKRIVTSGGSAGSMVDACLSQGIECLICGEIKYHEALDASLSGLSIIELGHDVSEFPLCAVLATHVQAAGVAKERITMIDQKDNWYTPESSRR